MADKDFKDKLDNKNIQRIRVNEKQGLKVNVVSSRSHKTGAEKDFLRKIGDHEEHQVGSSLKFCLVASGRADIYPRFGPTSEWDIAAGDAILKFSGGGLLDENRNSILYNKKRNIINGSFFAFGDRANLDNFYTKFLESTAWFRGISVNCFEKNRSDSLIIFILCCSS